MNTGNLNDLNNDEKTKTLTAILNGNGCQNGNSSSQNGLLKQLMAAAGGDPLKMTSNCSLSSNATELNDSINEIESVSSDLKSCSSSSLKLDSNESANNHNNNKHRMFHSITSLLQSASPNSLSTTPAFTSISNNMIQQQYLYHQHQQHHQQQLQQQNKSSPNIDSIKENMSALKSILANTIYSSTPEQLYLQMPPFGSHSHPPPPPPPPTTTTSIMQQQHQMQSHHQHHHLQFENKTIDFKALYENLSDEKRQQLMLSHQHNSYLLNNINNASPTQLKSETKEVSYHSNASNNKRQLTLSPNTNSQSSNKKKDFSNSTTATSNKTVSSSIELDVNKLIESSKSNPQLDMVLSNLAAMAGTFLHHQNAAAASSSSPSSFSPLKSEQTLVISNSNNNFNNQKSLLIKDETNKSTNKMLTETNINNSNNDDSILNETKNN